MKRFLFIFLAMASAETFAQNAFKTQSVSIFKDGNAFYVKSGVVKSPDGRFRLEADAIPQARNGTLWFFSPSNGIASIVSHTDTIKSKTDVKVVSIAQLLASNKGKKVMIEALNLKNALYEGSIEEMEGDVLHLKTTEGKFVSLAIQNIARAEFFEKPSMITKVTDNQKLANRLDVNFIDKKTEQDLEMMYLQQGLSWSPFYYLELLSDKKARLTLRSEVVNNAEDLDNTTINFVVGVPNFKFASSLAGIVDFTNRIVRNDDNYGGGAVYQNYAVAPMMMSAKMADNSESFNNEIEGQSVEDLYFYPLKNFTLKKGNKAHYQLFNEEIPYEHIYECQLVNQNDFSQNYQNQMNGANPNKVYHSLKIKNESKNPFTTAPVTIIQKTNGQTQPLAQDMVNFTPKKGESNIKITASPDVQVSQIESVKNRDENGKTLFGQQYFKATIEAKVTIKNFKDKPINFELCRHFSGTLGKSDLAWKILQQTVPVYTPNTENQIAWNLSLKAGEEKVITYTYDVYGHN
jgi:hypothetical protein